MFSYLISCSAYDFPINENGGDTFFWNDDDCNKTFRFVCEAYTEKYHKPVDKWLPSGQPTTAGCQNGWTKYAGGCYRQSLQKTHYSRVGYIDIGDEC